MYRKIAWRNVKRSLHDYMLYIVTMVLFLILMFVSILAAHWGMIQAGLETASLPLFISLMLYVLILYLHDFIIKKRSQEFASYLLMGMEKPQLIRMFLGEFLCVGLCCFLLSSFVCLIGCLIEMLITKQSIIILYFQSLIEAFGYFCIMELCCAVWIHQRFSKLQIAVLMKEKKYIPQRIHKYSFFSTRTCFFLFFSCFIILMCCICLWNHDFLISIVFLPLFGSMVSFYHCFFRYLYTKRKQLPKQLYKYDRLYVTAAMTSANKQFIYMNIVFCLCLFCSLTSFVFSMFMMQEQIQLFDSLRQQWMGIMQFILCLIFLVLYFSSLSFHQISEIRRRIEEYQILYTLGKDKEQLFALLRKQLRMKLGIPMVFFLCLLFICFPLLDYKLRMILPYALHSLMFTSAFGFLLCFIILYVIYDIALYLVSKHYVEAGLDVFMKRFL